MLLNIRERCAQKDTLFLLIFCSFFINILALIFPLVLLQTYDRVIPNQSLSTLTLLVTAIAISLILETFLKIIRIVIGTWADSRFEHCKSSQAFKHILHANPKVYEKLGSGDLLDQMTAFASVRDFYTGQLLISFIDIPFVIIFLALIAYLTGWLVLLPIFILVFYFLFILSSSKMLKSDVKARQETDDKRTNFIVQILTKIHTLKAMAMEAGMLRRYERLQEQAASLDYNLVIQSGYKTSLSQTTSQLTLVITVSIGALLVLGQSISIGSLAAAIFLSNRVLQPVNRLASLWTRLQSIEVAESHIESIFDYPSEHNHAKILSPATRGDITIQQMRFSYPNATKSIFTNINLSLTHGEFISIRGDSLAGKSTLLWLMQGILAPTSGTISLDDIEYQKINPTLLRQQIAYLNQNAVLFEGSIMDNLLLFKGTDGLALAKQYALSLRLDKYIQRLPQGFETQLGKSSSDILPRGIKQRIAIIRALVCNPKVLLFDEANTAMDLEADFALKSIFNNLKGKMSMVIVSHRPSILSLADRHYVIKDGVLHDDSE